MEGHVPHRRGLFLDAGLPAGHRVSRRGRARAHRHAHPGLPDSASARCRFTARSPRRARTVRAAFRCWKISCRGGAARRSCSCCSGFAATDFVITITLSAADATEHIVHNPFVPRVFDHPIAVTIVLLTALGAIFLKGFKEAIGIAVVIVAVYLALNVFVIAYGVMEILRHPEYVPRWTNALYAQHGNPVMMLAFALLVFPKLALGLSGFETGVAVMPLVAGDRVHNTRKLLRTAALIMSVLLIGSSDRDDAADPARGVRRRRRGVGPRARLPRSSLPRRDCSGRFTTSARSPFSGSPAHRRWPACSISSHATCLGTAWRRSGRARRDRS